MRIVLVDACPVFREGLRTIITNTMREARIVAEADSYRVIRDQIHKDSDLLIVDGDLEALHLLHELRKRERPSRRPFVLILAAHTDNHHAVQFLSAGAEGYLSKSAAAEGVLDAIRKVAYGRKYVSTEVRERILADVGNKSESQPLSQREYEVLSLLASGLQVCEIADRLALSPKTVSTYRVRLLEKLHLRNNSELMRYAYQKGIMH
jgi:two-component system invasion response regulator UvrY